jgi:hypothetical protein
MEPLNATTSPGEPCSIYTGGFFIRDLGGLRIEGMSEDCSLSLVLYNRSVCIRDLGRLRGDVKGLQLDPCSI